MGEAIIDIGEFLTGGLGGCSWAVVDVARSERNAGGDACRIEKIFAQRLGLTAGANDLGRFIFGRIGLWVFNEDAVGVRSSLATERAL